MADTKISGLAAVTDVLSTDEFVLARAGATNKIDAIDLAGGLFPSPWDLIVDLPLDSLTGFTAGGGTWTDAGSEIQLTTVGTTKAQLRYDTQIPAANVIYQVEFFLDSTMSQSTTTQRAGLIFGWDGSGDSGTSVWFEFDNKTPASNGTLQSGRLNVQGDSSINLNLALDTWHTLRVVTGGVGGHSDSYVNGSFIGRMKTTIQDSTIGYIGLYGFQITVLFRNLQVWAPALPA